MDSRSTSEDRHLGLHKGAWTKEEDALLRKCMEKYGAVRWSLVPKRAGLNRCRKSCRLRWLNYLCPNIKRGKFEDAEVDLIIRLHKLLGNRWSLIAGRIPGRTANDIKNYWNTHLSNQSLVKKDGKEPNARNVEAVKPKPQCIPYNWRWSKDTEASQDNHHQEGLDIPIQAPSSHNNAACMNSIIGAENLNVSVSNTEELEKNFGFENIGSIGDDDFLLEGFKEWDDMYLDMDLWRDFEAI